MNKLNVFIHKNITIPSGTNKLPKYVTSRGLLKYIISLHIGVHHKNIIAFTCFALR